MKQFLLNNAKNNTDVNVESLEHISLSTKQRILPIENTQGIINHYELYLKERNECDNFKMFFTLKPYMTNVLFNAFTEIVYNEGSPSSGIITPYGKLKNGHSKYFSTSIGNELTRSALLGEGIFEKEFNVEINSDDFGIDRRYQLIRDTEYNHPSIGVLNYHCGIDIFNNHFLRSDGFFRIRDGSVTLNNKNITNSQVFNTIKDYLVYHNGIIATHNRETPGNDILVTGGTLSSFFETLKKIVDNYGFFTGDTTVTNTVERPTHLFNYDNFKDIFSAFSDGIKDDNGWVGFNNKSYLPEKNVGKFIVNKCINYQTACDFIDLYPDRTLFSLTPKINANFGNREEYNWKWCLTYPYENAFYDSNNVEFDFFNSNGLKVIWNTRSSLYEKKNGNFIDVLSDLGNCVIRESRLVYFRTKCKHNLNEGDVVKFTYDNGDFVSQVIGVGNENGVQKEYYFCVSYDDLSDELGEKTYKTQNGISVLYIIIPRYMSIAKLIDNEPCQYYVRKFRKLAEIPSTLNRLAFSKTVYNDDVIQIMYDENINISGLKDNLGRDISELYFTIVKNNFGWEDYYLNGVTTPTKVEYSHCFGKVSSGFNFECDTTELSDIQPDADYGGEKTYFQKHNIRSLYNLENFDNTKLKDFCNIMGIKFLPPHSIESNITIDNETFYGDFVEFSPSQVKEVVLEDVYHRFNTAQRETNLLNEHFRFDKFRYDEIIFDDYSFDFKEKTDIIGAEEEDVPEFKVGINNNGFRGEKTSEDVRDNIFPEGYFYKPHYRVKLREYSEVLKTEYDIEIAKGDNIKVNETDKLWRYSITTKENYAFNLNDKIILYYSDGSYREYPIYEGCKDNVIIIFEQKKSVEEMNRNLTKIFYKSPNVPDYAYYYNDGTGKHIWREIINDSEIGQESDIYNRTYANGAIYINNNIDFYVRRQDPFGIYGLKYADSASGEAGNFIVNGVIANLPDIDYKTNESGSICEI